MNAALKVLLVMLVLVTQVGCSAFQFFVERSVNNFENRAANRINSFADFNLQQKDKIDEIAAEIDDWMRIERLSQLSTMLFAFADDIETQGQISDIHWRAAYQEIERGFLLSNAIEVNKGFTDLALSLSDQQVQQVIEKMDERFEERQAKREGETIEDINKRFISNINWLFRASNRSLKSAERAQAVTILNELKFDIANNNEKIGSRINRLQGMILQRNNSEMNFQTNLEEFWREFEEPYNFEQPDVAEYNYLVTSHCMNYLLSNLNEKNRSSMARVLRKYSALFERLSKS